MRKPRASKEGRRPRLQIDVNEVLSRAVGMAAAKRGMSVSAWVIGMIYPHLSEEILQVQKAIAEAKDNYTDVG